jgi:hypothetical protein
LHLCGTHVPAEDRGFWEEAGEWYRHFRSLPAPRFPLALPYFLDLAALVVHTHPPFRHPLDGVLKDYVNVHLTPLAADPAVRFVRRQLGRVRHDRSLAVKVVPRAVARFVRQVMLSLTRIWGDSECAGRWLSDPLAVRSFLQENTERIARHPDLRDLIPPMERFLIGAARVAGSHETANGELIAKCLGSPELTEYERTPHPVVRAAGRCTDVVDKPGEVIDIRRVCRTSELRKIAQVVPQDFALLGLGPEGLRHFLHKLTHEGVLMWERQHPTDRTTRRRILVCFAAAAGATVNHFQSAFYFNSRIAPQRTAAGAIRSDSIDTHARQLIFDLCRDVGLYRRCPGLDLDLYVYLDGDCGRRRQIWEITREELEECIYGDRYESMMEMEARTPGYFFEREGLRTETADSPQRYLEHLARQSGYDGMVFVLFGPGAHLFDLLPGNVRYYRRHQGRSDVIKLVRLSHWPDHVEVASARGFGDLGPRQDFQFMSDVNLRYSVLEAVFGSKR